jgi:hypothetical protein
MESSNKMALILKILKIQPKLIGKKINLINIKINNNFKINLMINFSNSKYG